MYIIPNARLTKLDYNQSDNLYRILISGKSTIDFHAAKDFYIKSVSIDDSCENLNVRLKKKDTQDSNIIQDLQPVERTGKWIKDEERSKDHVEPIFFCSYCENMEAWGLEEVDTFKFCPHCGAKMVGVEYE